MTKKFQSSEQAFHIHAIRLPDGDRAEDWWIKDGVLHEQPIAHAKDLPGKYVIGGMVDAHTHLSMDFGLFGLPEASDAVIRANLQNKLRQGVTAVRDTGALPGAKIDLNACKEVRVLTCGNFNFPKGKYYDHIHVPVEADELVAVALQEVARGSQWVKIAADAPGPDMNYFDPNLMYPIEILREMCEAVHAKGARVAAHISGPRIGEFVRAGIDSVEHGTTMTADVLAEMAQRGVAWVPTLTTVTRATEMLINMGVPFADVGRRCMEQLRRMVPLAEKLGVTVMVGTDEHPNDYADEVSLLCEFGLSSKKALAATSDQARAYLRLPVFGDGATTGVVLFDDDPRERMEVLGKPSAVVV
jgi:imidazolonepropionase-like amidohydrolase